MSDTVPKINAPKQSDGPRPIKALGRNQQVSVVAHRHFLGLAALFLLFPADQHVQPVARRTGVAAVVPARRCTRGPARFTRGVFPWLPWRFPRWRWRFAACGPITATTSSTDTMHGATRRKPIPTRRMPVQHRTLPAQPFPKRNGRPTRKFSAKSRSRSRKRKAMPSSRPNRRNESAIAH